MTTTLVETDTYWDRRAQQAVEDEERHQQEVRRQISARIASLPDPSTLPRCEECGGFWYYPQDFLLIEGHSVFLDNGKVVVECSCGQRKLVGVL